MWPKFDTSWCLSWSFCAFEFYIIFVVWARWVWEQKFIKTVLDQSLLYKVENHFDYRMDSTCFIDNLEKFSWQNYLGNYLWNWNERTWFLYFHQRFLAILVRYYVITIYLSVFDFTKKNEHRTLFWKTSTGISSLFLCVATTLE